MNVKLAWDSGIADGDTSEGESDTKILQLTVTEEKMVPNGPDPVVPLIPREPDAPIHGHRCSEVERLANVARPPPTHEKRRVHAAIGPVSDNHASVGVVEIKDKDAEKVRRHAYNEALLATESTHLHNEPVDVKDTKQKPDWSRWKAVMQEELDSLD